MDVEHAEGRRMTPSAALVTVTYNSSQDLKEHWAHARSLGVDWIVVDNGSSDDSALVAEGLGARVARLPRNMGFSAANNIAAEMARADCLIFLNPDVQATAEGITHLAQIAVDLDACVAPQLINPDGTEQENGRYAPYLYRKFLHYFGSGASRTAYEIVAAPGELKQVTWVIGAAIAVPASIFRQIGGWDPTFFVYYEDSDICLRARDHGYLTLLSGGVRWIHGWKRATRRSLSFQAWKMEFSSAFKFYRRYPKLLLHPRLLRTASTGYYVDVPACAQADR
jgi:N-acetylglucosaminyl-diphospho-decaprenol L-rhamnosyltransferase